MSDSIGHDATPHPRDASSPHHNINKNHDSGDSDSDDVSTPPFLSRPHSRQSNTSSTPVVVTGAESATTTTPSKPREAFRPSVFGTHTGTTTTTKETSSKSKSKSTHSRKASGTDALESDDSDSGSSSGDEKTGTAAGGGGGGGGGRRRKGSRRRRFSDSASHLLAQAPPVPDLRFDNNYRKALNQIYETHAKETAAAAAASGTTIDASDEKKSASGTALQQTQSSSLSSSSKKDRKVPGIAARITVMTVRDIIIMPFIHGFFWGFGTIMLTLAGQRSLMYHVQRTWRKTFGGSGDGNADEVMNLSRGQPARVRRVGGGFGGVGLMNAGSASAGGGGFARPAGHY
ncbi:hypothetical protein BGX24_012082 [Mortierella sp. AD032]|nr:hypothetical protein BGX24_012082 [Mortierella sp. AD032]